MTTLQCQVLAVSLALVLSKHCVTWLWVISTHNFASNCAATSATSTASSFALGLTSSQPISRHILCHLTLCNTFLEHPIRAYQGLSGPIKAYQGLSGPIRAYQGLSGPIRAYQCLSGPIYPSESINQAHKLGAMNQHLRKCVSSLPNVIPTYSNKSPCKMCSQASQAFKNKGGTRPPNTSTILDHPSTQHRPSAESTSLQIPRPQSSSQQHLTSSDIQ